MSGTGWVPVFPAAAMSAGFPWLLRFGNGLGRCYWSVSARLLPVQAPVWPYVGRLNLLGSFAWVSSGSVVCPVMTDGVGRFMPRPEVFWTSCVAVTSAGVRPLRTGSGYESWAPGRGYSVERTDNRPGGKHHPHIELRGPHDREGMNPGGLENAYGSHRHLRAPPGTT